MEQNYEAMLELEPYSLEKEKKQELLSRRLISLSEQHYETCETYKRIVDAFGIEIGKTESYYELPFLPVRLFKEMELRSVPKEEVVKTMTSSGTSGQRVSRIYVDRKTAGYQQKTLVKLVSSFTGSARMPMLIIDCPSVIKNRAMFSARGAGILGFSIFGRDKLYALNDEMQLDVEGVSAFLERHKGEQIFLFGFTFMIWQHFYKEFKKFRQKGIVWDLSNGILIHGGGWKKLKGEAISCQEFRGSLQEACGLHKIYDYYGMVEQTGCIYMQCEYGHFHASIFSDVIVRRPEDFSVCRMGEKGILQVVSAIPESYPGHSLLTEDEGVLLGEDDCPCGRKGKYFSVHGRLKNAEIRGCSDTYGAKF
ncbi:MAG: acyl-protein synthetase [Lachnospiraceae bacterium]|nr:acyl-protein synthetase [Lachnospiraceae bacterium]